MQWPTSIAPIQAANVFAGPPTIVVPDETIGKETTQNTSKPITASPYI